MARRETRAIAIAIAITLQLFPGAGPALQEGEPAEPPVEPAPPPPDEPAPTDPAPAEPAPAEPVPAEPAAPGPPAPPQPRVIVRVDRNREVAGWVELEDTAAIVIRTPRGEVESFAQGRIARVIRLVEPRPGQEGEVVLRNGQSRRGVILVDEFDFVEIEIEGVRTRLDRDVVDVVYLEPTFEEKYAHFKATIAPDMISRHLDLCRWLISERRFDLAKEELLALLARTENADARQLLRIAEASLAIRNMADSGDGDATANAEGGGDGDLEGEGASDDDAEGVDHPLDPGDVNVIRVYEIDFDRPPRLAVRSRTIATLIERYGTNKLVPAEEEKRRKLYQADPIDVVRLLFELRARELYPEIEVLSEPYALNLFRQRVHDTWLMNNCATSRCHGGAAEAEAGEPTTGGRFLLYRRGSRDERTRYANLLILDRLEIEPDWPLVNYQKPADSLIIQYGLPRTVARKPHPPARGWKPAFRHGDDRMIIDVQRWIQAMYQPRPDYPVSFVPPQPALPIVDGAEEGEGEGEGDGEGERERQPR